MKLLIQEFIEETVIRNGVRGIEKTCIGGESLDECKVGGSFSFAKGKRQFIVSEVTEDTVVLEVCFDGQEKGYYTLKLKNEYGNEYSAELEENGRTYYYEFSLKKPPQKPVYDESRCISHPNAKPVHHCENCGAPICASCYANNQIYSVAAEGALHLCLDCYNASVRYYDKHR